MLSTSKQSSIVHYAALCQISESVVEVNHHSTSAFSNYPNSFSCRSIWFRFPFRFVVGRQLLLNLRLPIQPETHSCISHSTHRITSLPFQSFTTHYYHPPCLIRCCSHSKEGEAWHMSYNQTYPTKYTELILVFTSNPRCTRSRDVPFWITWIYVPFSDCQTPRTYSRTCEQSRWLWHIAFPFSSHTKGSVEHQTTEGLIFRLRQSTDTQQKQHQSKINYSTPHKEFT